MVPGKVGVATGGMVQQDLFGDRCEYGDRGGRPAEPVLMALHAEYYELIWRGLKTHEFRRRFLEGRPARWFVYLNAPVSRLAAVIDLGPAVVGVLEQIAEIAERARAGERARRPGVRRGPGAGLRDPDPGRQRVSGLVGR